MFNCKKQSYTRKTRNVSTDNPYNEQVETYIPSNTILMFISLSNEMTLASNDMRIQQCSHIGLTKDDVEVGDLIDDKYEVQFINNAGREKIVFMKEIENDGSFI